MSFSGQKMQRADKNSMTTLIVKSSLYREVISNEKTPKKSFLEYCTFHQIQPKYNDIKET